MFENLSEKVLGTLKKLKGESKITETNIESTLKEIRLHLLEADVHYKVVKNFVERVKNKLVGTEVLKSVSPSQQFIKAVHDELVFSLGGESKGLNLNSNPAIIFLVGLQGVGKTTTAAKLSLYIRQKLKKNPVLLSVDVYRPAAIEQLQTLAKQNSMDFVEEALELKPIERYKKALAALKSGDVLIVDTAGRLQIDSELMNELSGLKAIQAPDEMLLIVDSMLGQQSVDMAVKFHQQVQLSGLILTKVDGDARGGAALSIREVVGIPIKFLGTGEKVGGLEVFHPDRLAGRILDFGDVVTLVEQAQELVSQDEAEQAAKKILKNKFTIEDFLKHIQMLKKMGGIGTLLKMLPGMGDLKKQMENMTPPDQEMKKIESMIRSMTIQERQDHKILNGSRRARIARGSGNQVQDVNKFIKQFEDSQKMMQQMMKMGAGGAGKMPSLPGMSGRSGQQPYQFPRRR